MDVKAQVLETCAILLHDGESHRMAQLILMTDLKLHCCPAGSLTIAYTLATVGANKLWELMNSEPFVPALGALSGNQAMQMVRAGLKAVYCSGWQVSTHELVVTSPFRS